MKFTSPQTSGRLGIGKWSERSEVEASGRARVGVGIASRGIRRDSADHMVPIGLAGDFSSPLLQPGP